MTAAFRRPTGWRQGGPYPLVAVDSVCAAQSFTRHRTSTTETIGCVETFMGAARSSEAAHV